MDNSILIAQLREICRAPGPERKKEFFKNIEEQGLLRRRPVVMSHGEFLLGQFSYIRKRTWLLSAAILLFITGICAGHPGNYPFALTPFLAAGILVESGRSFRFKMAELEHSARFSLRSVVFARAFLVGAVDTIGLVIVICVIRPMFSYSMVRVFLYMMVPYLTASLAGSVYERRHRSDNGWGSIAICILTSALFAAAPLALSSLYEERMTIIWAAAFILLVCSLAVSMHRWMSEMEEPAWSL